MSQATRLWIALSLVPLLVAAGVAGAGEDAAAGENNAALTLQATSKLDQVASGEPIEMVASFAAAGDEAAHLYVPPYVFSTNFPEWRFTHTDGRVYVPHQPMFQAGWQIGLQGEIVVLKPGATREFKLRCALFVRLRESRVTEDAVPLPVGSYEIRAVYERESRRLPYGTEGMRVEYRKHAEIFTGTLRSKALALEVTASKRPVLSLDAPESARPGEAFPLRIRVANQSSDPIDDDAAVRVRVTSKAFGGGSATFVLDAGKLLPATPSRAVSPLALAPGGAHEVTLELTSASYEQQHRGTKRTRGFFEMLGPGSIRIEVQLVDAKGITLAGAGFWRGIKALDLDATAPLSVRIEKLKAGIANPIVEVVVRNTSAAPVRIPAGLSYPRRVFFSIVDADAPGKSAYRVTTTVDAGFDVFSNDEPGTRAQIAPDLAWNGDRFERAPALEARTFVHLPPGGELRRRFRLGDLIDRSAGLEGRIVQVRAFYRNREQGLRMGLQGVYTGLIGSPAVEVRGRIW